MGDTNAVDILFRFRDQGAEKVKTLGQQLAGAGAAAQRMAASGSASLKAFGEAGVWAGNKINSMLSFGIEKLIHYGKYVVAAGAAFATWQIKKGVDWNAQLETMSVRLGVLYKSTALANQEIQRFRSISKGSPFNVSEIADAARAMREFGIGSTQWIKTAADMAAVTGKSIGEVAHAMSEFAAGREEFAIREFMGMGVSVRAMPGLKWNATGQLANSGPGANAALQAGLAEKFGGGVEALRGTFSGQWKELMENFDRARGQVTEQLFGALKKVLEQLNANWDRIWNNPRVQSVLKAVGGALADAVKYAERLAEKFGSAFDKGGLGAGLKAVSSLYGLGGAAVGGIGRAAGGIIGTAGTRLPYALEGAAGGWNYMAGGSGALGWLGAQGALGAGAAQFLSAAAVPLAIAVAAGLVGRWAIGQIAQNHADRVDQRIQNDPAAFVNRTYHHMADDFGAQAMADEQSKLREVLEGAAVAWRELLDVQERMRTRLQETLDEMRVDGEALLSKFRTPEQQFDALRGRAMPFQFAQEKALDAFGAATQDITAGRGDQVENYNRLHAAQQTYLNALSQEHKLQIQIFEVEEQRQEKMREQVRSIEELTNADRTRLLGLKEQFKVAQTPEQIARLFESLTPEAQRLSKLARTPEQEAMLQQYLAGRMDWKIESQADALKTRQGMEAGFAERAGMVGAPTDADVAKSGEQIVRNAQQRLDVEAHVKITSDDVHLVISEDARGKGVAAIHSQSYHAESGVAP